MEFFSRSPDQTRRLGMRLGSLLQPGDVIGLSGDLGAGKTTLVQGIAQGWGSLDAVSSPTFVLVNQYRRPDGQVLYHLDSYRLGSVEEAIDLDLDIMMENGALVVEWAELIKPALPKDTLWIQLRWVADERRNMVFTPTGERYEKIMAEFRHQVFGG
ncbi:MAG: tRNA (adenosine(37)-N6)-threonylcarbamoyltransferase complex ATPase subunit type 1 TsaE [Anaerolineaceae bacterium]|nr:tRNA (adenosine(37)-N6)-threonylcarbamoyltransferase complex ATPase subunit type 1 TsaE [Anaerolineaceae bacterium]NTV36470.1 tRNA (adenosine(37)-N6)-threonylcarbamoyltransferase complex ATPase subunit type 1 TsaE [Anaerolineaceae bacterium]